MQFAGLNYVFYNSYYVYGGGGGVGKNCTRCLQYKTRVVLKTTGTVFIL